MFEIYNEAFNDLLLDEKKPSQKPVVIGFEKRITGDLEERVKNLTEVCIETMDQFNHFSELANSRRKIASTQRNFNSSRSHGIVQVKLEGYFNGKPFNSILMLLDLAGSENANDHLELDVKNQERVGEMKKINQSICAFGTLINNLKKGGIADFRSTKLTSLLKPFLTSNSKTFIVTTAAQELKYFSTSKASLTLASTAIGIPISNTKRNIDVKKK